MAANATFALKPGVWFLRVRFVIFAPDSRREPSPPSGRKSTQPTVQILEASSENVLVHAVATIERIRRTDPRLTPVLTLRHLSELTGAPYGYLRRVVGRKLG